MSDDEELLAKSHSQTKLFEGFKLEGCQGFTQTLFHQTSGEVFTVIDNTQEMKCSQKGMLGPGIYFAETPEETSEKAHCKGVTLAADVILGVQYVVCGAHRDLNFETIQKCGANSIKGVGYRTGTEYVVFDPSQVTKLRIVRGPADCPICQNPNCLGFMTNHPNECAERFPFRHHPPPNSARGPPPFHRHQQGDGGHPRYEQMKSARTNMVLGKEEVQADPPPPGFHHGPHQGFHHGGPPGFHHGPPPGFHQGPPQGGPPGFHQGPQPGFHHGPPSPGFRGGHHHRPGHF